MIDVEEAALMRLAKAAMPSAYSVSAGNRRDVVAEAEQLARLEEARTELALAIEHLIRWAVRRIRRRCGL